MEIEDKKQYLKEWEDFYGYPIPDDGLIESAKTEEDIEKIIHNFEMVIESRQADERSHVDSLRQTLKNS